MSDIRLPEYHDIGLESETDILSGLSTGIALVVIVWIAVAVVVGLAVYAAGG